MGRSALCIGSSATLSPYQVIPNNVVCAHFCSIKKAKTKTMKKGIGKNGGIKAATICAAIFGCLFQAVAGQGELPFNQATQKVTYHFTLPTSGKVTPESAMTVLKSNIYRQPDLFTRANGMFASNVSGRTFNELETEFDNSHPLQSVDPQSGRMAVRVMVKYCSGKESKCLQMMYVQYYLVCTATAKGIEVEVTDIRYNHFNRKSGELQRIFSWSDYNSCDAISTIEYLVKNENCHTDFATFASFFNQDVAKLQSQLSALLENSNNQTMN